MRPLVIAMRAAAVVGLVGFSSCERDAQTPARGAPQVNAASAAVTPMDQGNDRTDLDTTQIIRRAIVGIPGLSITAQNIMVVTAKGEVTLRGTVKDVGEQELVLAAANTAAGQRRVDNQLALAAR